MELAVADWYAIRYRPGSAGAGPAASALGAVATNAAATIIMPTMPRVRRPMGVNRVLLIMTVLLVSYRDAVHPLLVGQG
jgi:hypothetical protein